MGRAGWFEVEIGQDRGQGLVAIYKNGPGFEVVALDADGEDRPRWAAAFRRRPLRALPVTRDTVEHQDWPAMIRRLGARFDPGRRPHALAAIAVRPAP